MNLPQLVQFIQVDTDLRRSGKQESRHGFFRRLVQQAVQSCRRRLALLSQQLQPAHGAADLGLDPDHLLLVSLARSVTGLSQILVVIQQGLLLPYDFQGPVQIGYVVEVSLHAGGDFPFPGAVEPVSGRRPFEGDLAFQVQLSEPGKLLTERERAQLRTFPGFYAAKVAAEAHHGIGKSGLLGHLLESRTVTGQPGQDGGVGVEGGANVLTQQRVRDVEGLSRIRLSSNGSRVPCKEEAESRQNGRQDWGRRSFSHLGPVTIVFISNSRTNWTPIPGCWS